MLCEFQGGGGRTPPLNPPLVINNWDLQCSEGNHFFYVMYTMKYNFKAEQSFFFFFQIPIYMYLKLDLRTCSHRCKSRFMCQKSGCFSIKHSLWRNRSVPPQNRAFIKLETLDAFEPTLLTMLVRHWLIRWSLLGQTTEMRCCMDYPLI